ncbi:MAG: aminotransferase class I/II-fold pyridoxal phosphate-dependent enzyme [Candidatus Spechtbacteria bacterium]|nr:aminotransferase class I/II-fold pyridoxal phosphate-dependent enzyme [Candidatus Spechtbacteria bacterium]
MIYTSLSPNTQNDDRRLAWSVLIRPWNWRNEGANKKLQKALAQYLGTTAEVLLFNSGRSAFLTLLKALRIQPGDEILVQAFTCNAVPNPVLWWGAKPVFVDIEKDGYNMDPMDLEHKITPRCKAVVVQHTFGIPANMDALLRVAKNHKLFVIEDCAHALGAEWGGKRVGTIGDATFFSFGRDKVISSVYGGALIVNKKIVSRRALQEWTTLPCPSYLWTSQQLLHPLFMAPIIATYWTVGRYALRAAQRLHLLSKAVTQGERYGRKPEYFPARLPGALAILALHQLEKIELFSAHRNAVADMYKKALDPTPAKNSWLNMSRGAKYVFLRYPMRNQNRDSILQKAKNARILLGDWYDSVIAPRGTDFDIMNYAEGSCPNAEKAAREVFNLPTHVNISKQDARNVINFLKNIL